MQAAFRWLAKNLHALYRSPILSGNDRIFTYRDVPTIRGSRQAGKEMILYCDDIIPACIASLLKAVVLYRRSLQGC